MGNNKHVSYQLKYLNSTPVVRQIHAQPSTTSTSFRERLGALRRNGTPEIAIGSIMLVVIGMEYFLQRQDDNERENVYHQLEREVRRDEITSHNENKMLLNGGVATKTKFQCLIRKVPQNFDGHKCLKNVKVGDIVGVIQEGVGPGGQYNLCSIERIDAKHATNKKEDSGDDESNGKRVSIGWFPCSCLQKVE